MKEYSISGVDQAVSCIGYGCMQIGGSWDRSALTAERVRTADLLVNAALEQGINLFDHADIYCVGKSEKVFGELLKSSPSLRSQITIQSKCGIRFKDDPDPGLPARYDLSYEHIVQSTEQSLHRLNSDYLDLMLLHRPDPLMEPEQVAAAFDHLHSSGKVRAFGVSNHSAAQIALLQSYLDQPIVVNQLELSLLSHDLISDGMLVNTGVPATAAVTGILDYCRLHEIRVQAWSPLAGGKLFGNQHSAGTYIKSLANEKSTSPEAIVLSWLLRHPAGIQPIVGTTQTQRLAAACESDQVELSPEQWYQLLEVVRGVPVP
ncbi:aldo/keto reductase family oxidoreductase [Motiliproteus sp. MSK22-1]|uniref:aldo/keto reductase n=1 Tax=Motiliproteus sp. MSK22-1 TaxID=1897630 RepID=UPI000975BF23|nr:aldo/keto reductase [Motiliproteus sp. MSK22-1]OMH25714.1 aldo/keto reductase [Motiliproteus sp. MSK22-1]